MTSKIIAEAQSEPPASSSNAILTSLIRAEPDPNTGSTDLTGNTSKSTESRYLTSREEIVQLFKLLRDLRAHVNLTIESSDISCTAQVLDVTDAHFFLENILPREGMQLLAQSNPFNIVARAEGLYTYITDCKVEQVSVERNLPYYLIALPQRVLYRQRRSYQRLKLPRVKNTKGAEIILYRGNEPLRGVLLDISVGGCRIQINHQVIPAFDQDEEIERCEIHIPNLLDLDSKAIIRYEQYNHARGIQTCGIELTEMSVSNRRRLERFIEHLSRRPAKAQ